MLMRVMCMRCSTLQLVMPSHAGACSDTPHRAPNVTPHLTPCMYDAASLMVYDGASMTLMHHATCVHHAGRALSLVVAAVLLGAFVGSAVEGWVRVDLFPLGVSTAIAITGGWVQHCDHWKQR